MASLDERLSNGRTVIMDGGVSTEMERKGLAMNDEVWSGIAHVVNADIVREVHEDYIKAGAEIITANSFAAAPHVLEGVGKRDDANQINHDAIKLAQQARDNVASVDVWIAGSMSSMPSLENIAVTATGPDARESYRQQATVLAEAGCDLILAEMMIDTENTTLVLEAAKETGLPVWIGFSAATDDKGEVTAYHAEIDFADMPPGDFGEVADNALAFEGQAAGIMHSEIEDTTPALDMLREHWSGPLMAYAETGKFTNPHWDFSRAVSPDDYAEIAADWVANHGVSIVGGCCGTGADHIRALSARLAG
ncbi:MAG: homocysteine S-methyltransferase family protein [Pseudomonadota bacterium]